MPRTLTRAVLVKSAALGLFGALLSLNCGCTVEKAVQPLEPTGFIKHPEYLAKPKYTPFSLAWMNRSGEAKLYDRLIVCPVRVDRVCGEDWVSSASAFIRGEPSYLEHVQELSNYFRLRLERELEAASAPDTDIISPGQYESGANALIIDVSIAEINFGDPIMYGGLLAVPVPAVANLSTAVKAPSMIIEARLIDAASNQVVAEIVDRRFPQVKVVDVNRLTVMSAVREITDSFVTDLVASLYRKPGQKVSGRWPFTLIPW